MSSQGGEDKGWESNEERGNQGTGRILRTTEGMRIMESHDDICFVDRTDENLCRRLKVGLMFEALHYVSGSFDIAVGQYEPSSTEYIHP